MRYPRLESSEIKTVCPILSWTPLNQSSRVTVAAHFLNFVSNSYELQARHNDIKCHDWRRRVNDVSKISSEFSYLLWISWHCEIGFSLKRPRWPWEKFDCEMCSIFSQFHENEGLNAFLFRPQMSNSANANRNSSKRKLNTIKTYSQELIALGGVKLSNHAQNRISRNFGFYLTSCN